MCPSVNPTIVDLRYVEEHEYFPPFGGALRGNGGLKTLLVNPNFSCKNISSRALTIALSGESVKYSVVDGAMYDHSETTLLAYPGRSKIGKARLPKLPNTVTTIGSRAFSNANLRKWKILRHVTRIMPNAFCSASCSSLELPKEVRLEFEEVSKRHFRRGKYIDYEGAFYYFRCDAFILPDSMEEIPAGSFHHCGICGGFALVVPDAVKAIGAQTFCGCRGWSIVVPDSVREIGADAYSGVASVSLPPHMAESKERVSPRIWNDRRRD